MCVCVCVVRVYVCMLVVVVGRDVMRHSHHRDHEGIERMASLHESYASRWTCSVCCAEYSQIYEGTQNYSTQVSQNNIQERCTKKTE